MSMNWPSWPGQHGRGGQVADQAAGLSWHGHHDAAVTLSELVLPREAVEAKDPGQLIAYNIRFCDYMVYRAHFRPEEMMPEPMWSYQVDYYVSEVRNGGHGQYIGNSRIACGFMDGTIRCVRQGLSAMGAFDCREIYEDMLALLALDAARTASIANSCGFGRSDPAVEALDRRFRAIGGAHPLMQANRDFLVGLPYLRIVPQEHWQAEVERLGRLNPFGKERQEAAARAREENHRGLPQMRQAELLCQKAGQEFIRFTCISTQCRLDGMPVQGWHLQTSEGLAVAFFLPGEALLCRHDKVVADDGVFPSGTGGPECKALENLFDYERWRDELAAMRTPVSGETAGE